MMLSAVARTLTSNLKYIYTRPLLINALRTNANHAERLCKTAPDSYFGAIGAAIKTAAMCQSRDYKVVNGATVPSYDAAVMGISMKWKQLLGRVKLGLMAAGGAVVLGLSAGVPPILAIVRRDGVRAPGRGACAGPAADRLSMGRQLSPAVRRRCGLAGSTW
jgi:hypothetical protein